MQPAPIKFQIEIVDVPQGKVVRLKGEVAAEEGDILKFQLTPVLNKKPKLVVFDLSGLRFIASAGLGALAAIRRSLVAAGAKGRIAAIPEKLKDLMKVSGMSQLYAVYDTVDQALAAPIEGGGLPGLFSKP
jgi:anti-anti-sigma factor